MPRCFRILLLFFDDFFCHFKSGSLAFFEDAITDFFPVIYFVIIFAEPMTEKINCMGFFCTKKAIAALMTGISLIFLFTACRGESEFRSMEGMIWNTGYHITYKGDESLADSVLNTLHSVEESVSVFSPTSVVSRINSNTSEEVDSVFSDVYRTSCRIFDLSGGYFDPTLAPLIEAYGFAGKEGKVPDKVATDSIMDFVGLKRTGISDGRLVKEDPRICFNFSAIAKGYGCDAVGEMFRRNGCNDFLVEIGGEITVSGSNSEAGRWRVQIDKPIFAADSVIHDAQVVIEITDCGVATSGNYRNFREQGDGKRFGHTFDPHTGTPALNDMLSATVVAPTCMEADAFATACMAMPFAGATEMARRCKLKVLLIRRNGEIWMSNGFEKLIGK